MTRDELAKSIIEAGKKKGATKEQLKVALDAALSDFDSQQTQKQSVDTATQSMDEFVPTFEGAAQQVGYNLEEMKNMPAQMWKTGEDVEKQLDQLPLAEKVKARYKLMGTGALQAILSSVKNAAEYTPIHEIINKESAGDYAMRLGKKVYDRPLNALLDIVSAGQLVNTLKPNTIARAQGDVLKAARGMTDAEAIKAVQTFDETRSIASKINEINKSMEAPPQPKKPNTLDQALIDTLEGQPASRITSTVQGKVAKVLFTGLTDSQRKRFGINANTYEALGKFVQAGDDHATILDKISKITGFDADGNPGIITQIKMEALSRAKVPVVEDMMTDVKKSLDAVENSAAPDKLKADITRMMTEGKVLTQSGQVQPSQQIANYTKILNTMYGDYVGVNTETARAARRVIRQTIETMNDTINKSVEGTDFASSLSNPQVLDAIMKNLGPYAAEKITQGLQKGNYNSWNSFERELISIQKGLTAVLDKTPYGSRLTGSILGSAGALSFNHLPARLASLIGAPIIAEAGQGIQQSIVPKAVTTLAKAVQPNSALMNTLMGGAKGIAQGATNIVGGAAKAGEVTGQVTNAIPILLQLLRFSNQQK